MTRPSPFLTIRLHPGDLAVVQLDPAEGLPRWIPIGLGGFVSLTWTAEELSVVAPAGCIPAGVRAETGWRLLTVQGPLPFEMVGVLASIAAPLAGAGVSLFALSTFDTDAILVRAEDLDRAVDSLIGAGHQVVRDAAEGVETSDHPGGEPAK